MANFKHFKNQVAGHGTILEVSETRICKPANETEKIFYENAVNGMTKYMAEYYGAREEGIELENVLVKFQNPNIMDIKIGILLHDDKATPEKKARMKQKAANSTTGSLGLRLSGMSAGNTRLGREYGFSITQNNFHEIFLQFTQNLDSETAKNVLGRFKNLVQEFLDAALVHALGTFIGTSLLFVYDESHEAIYWIDFAHSKWSNVPDDGFLFGIRNLLITLSKVS